MRAYGARSSSCVCVCQKPSSLGKPKGKGRPRIAAFFAKKRADVPGMLEQVMGWAQDEIIDKAEMSKEVAAARIQHGVERLDVDREARSDFTY